MNYNVIADSLKESFLIRKKKSLLLTAVATLGLTAATMAQGVPSYVPTNGLVGWWPFNGNANDESGNGNNGTVNGATLTTDRFGIANKAYSFDGVDDFLLIPSDVSDFSISLWFNFSAPSNQFSELFYFEDFSASIVQNGNYIYIRKQNQIISSIDLSTSQIINNQWNHIVVKYNSVQNTIECVLNNIEFFSSSITSGGLPNLINDNMFQIAGRQFNNTNFFNGQFDDISIWNRALTGQEITDLYNGCQLSVSSQPTNQTINISNNAQFVVSSSDPNATYQWQTDLGVGYQNLNSVGQYNGTTTNTLTVSNVTMSNNNQPFRCIINSGSCSDTSNVAVLTVNNNVGINETNQGNLFSVFPNPAQSIINVKTDSKLIGSVYSIFDNKGRVVQTGKINSENTTIELGNLSSGIYMFSVGENMKQSFKVIKE